MNLTTSFFATAAILPLGLGSIYVSETLRWHAPRRCLAVAIPGMLIAFSFFCAALTLHRYARLEVSLLLKTALQMVFAAYFLVALAYLLHCVTWAVTRLGRNVHMDELFSRMLALAIFSAADLGAYFCLSVCVS
jgi:hypothetical protein